MSACAELELSLWRGAEDGRHWVEARFQRPGEDRVADTAHGQILLDLARLARFRHPQDDGAYGQALAGMLFEPPAIRDLYTAARAAARAHAPPVPLRLRLRCEAGDDLVHALRWELLCDPGTPRFLATDEHVLLSRVLQSEQGSENVTAPPPRSDLRALAVIADPTDVGESYGMDGLPLQRVDPTLRTAVGAFLAGMEATWLTAQDSSKPTLDELIARLRDGYDVLYLVCHGALEEGGRGQPPAAKIWLEDENGKMATVYLDDQRERDGRVMPGLATRLAGRTRLPRLVVLSSCQSSGRSHDAGALAAFGPRLVAAGVPAVVAMQDDVAMATADTFAAHFFRALLDPVHGGEIDAAMAAGRDQVAGRADWAAPVLFMNLASGRLFDEAGGRAPFMAGELKGVVARPILLERAVAALVDGAGQPQVTTLALHGGGGFGKTTLARAVCHDPRVRKAFDGGILWATLGETPDVRGSLTELCAALSGQRQNFGSIADAGRELARLLEGRRCLLVIDDVWNRADLEPFLQGGARCARLITSRDATIAVAVTGAEAGRVRVEEMTAVEARALLNGWLAMPPADPAPFDALAARAGRLPLLLELLAGGLRMRVERGDSLDGALAYLNQALDEDGVVAFDVRNAQARSQAIEKSIAASLRLLSEEEKDRLRQMAIFPRDADVPLATVGLLWGTPPFRTERQCEAFGDLALLKFDLRTQTIRLHSVMRDYLLLRLPDPAACHLKLLAAWGDPHHLPTAYAWRWYTYHLAEAARLRQDLDLARGLVETVLDAEFQDAHLVAGHDPVALVTDVLLAVETLAGSAGPGAWPLEPAAIPLLVRAARWHVVTRTQKLAPEHLFGKAEAGDVAGAETYLGLFAAEGEWQQACRLIIAWLAVRRNPGEARSLFARASADLPNLGALPRLAACVGTVLAGEPWPQAWLPAIADRDVAAITARMAGLKDALGMPTEVNLNLQEVRNIDPTISSYEASVRMTLNDSQFLVGYAANHRAEPQGYLDDHLAILAGNSYRRYRNRFLWPLLDSVLCYPDAEWAQGWAVKVAVAALAPSKLEFQEGAAIMALALRAWEDPAAARGKLDAYRDAVGAIAHMLEHGPRGDSWGSFTRRLAALALAYRLLGEPAVSHDLIAQARRLHYGFAGFQSPAWQMLAETMRICSEPDAVIAAVREESRKSAVNVQDPVFCAQTTARWHALERWWSQSLDLLGLAAVVDDLRRGRGAERFTALHRVGEDYRGRGEETGDTMLPDWLREARTLAALAAVYDRPLPDLLRLNPGRAADEVLPDAALIPIPDPRLVSQIAGHLAAEALALPALAPEQRVQLIQALTPVALLNPSALDTLLARLLFAAGCAWGPGIAAEVADVFGDVAGFLRQRAEADLPAGAPPPYEVWPGG